MILVGDCAQGEQDLERSGGFQRGTACDGEVAAPIRAILAARLRAVQHDRGCRPLELVVDLGMTAKCSQSDDEIEELGRNSINV
jgi:hypothetical protein